MAKKKSLKGKGYYAVYASTNQAEKNRIAKIKRHLKKHPEDAQAQAALKQVGTRRAASNTKGNHPKPESFYRNSAGHKVLMPNFDPATKK
jgi:hypothetical protein